MIEGSITGFAPITKYELFWDSGLNTSVFTSIGNTSSNYFEQTTGISSGNTYKFKLLPHNAYGPGTVYSPEFEILASVPPSKMPTIVTSMAGTKVRFAWTLPTFGSGSIDQYRVSFFNGVTNLFFENLTMCNGSSSAIVTARQCDIEMAIVKT